MSPAAIELLGFAAAALTSLCWLPAAKSPCVQSEIARVSRVRMVRQACAGTALWLSYGIQILSWPVIAANALTLLLVLVIISMKLRFG